MDKFHENLLHKIDNELQEITLNANEIIVKVKPKDGVSLMVKHLERNTKIIFEKK